MGLIRDFKPALLFLGKFLAIYLAGNIIYGLYVESYQDAPDAVTRNVTAQTSFFLNMAGYNSAYEMVPAMPKVAMMDAGDLVLYVFEGCNGVNVAVVFIAFLFAYGGPLKWFAVFLPLGLFLIHFFNLLRIGLLYHLAVNNSTQFYYYHKYFFTAILYLVVFALWAIWIMRVNDKPRLNAFN